MRVGDFQHRLLVLSIAQRRYLSLAIGVVAVFIKPPTT